MTGSARSLHDCVVAVSEHGDERQGVPLPLGAHAYGGGVNFALFSRHASRARLELFDRTEDSRPARFVDLDPAHNPTGDVWHVWLEGVRSGQLYACRVDGQYQPRDGHRFNFHTLLLGLCATAISQMPGRDYGPARGYDPAAPEQDLACSLMDAAGAMPTCVFTHEYFHWQDDLPEAAVEGQARRAPAVYQPVRPGPAGDPGVAMESMTLRGSCG